MSLSPVEKLGIRVAYGLSQAPRLAWYLGHGYAMRRLARRHKVPAHHDQPAPSEPKKAKGPSQGRLYRDLARLLARDLANVEAGVYPLPAGEDGSIADRIATSRLFFEDLPRIARRRAEGDGQEVFKEGLGEGLPRYYRQNFHFQTDGWLSEQSARLYDFQVEVLFGGAANAMRRQALVPIREAMRGRDQRQLRLLDVACGAGRFLHEVQRTFPALRSTGLDLSEAYLSEARRSLGPSSRLSFVAGAAEAMPFPSNSFDIVTCIYLFHELPPEMRRRAAAEIARVLQPDGLFVLVDSLQHGDVPEYDGLLDHFPDGFHEPYFTSYIDEDFGSLFGAAGLTPVQSRTAWLSKVMSFRRVA